jgi:hypothetical protein
MRRFSGSFLRAYRLPWVQSRVGAALVLAPVRLPLGTRAPAPYLIHSWRTELCFQGTLLRALAHRADGCL